MKRSKAIVGLVGILLCLAVAGALVSYATGIPPGATYVGTSKCRLCHLKEHKTWKATKHATNFEVLQGDEVKNPECLKCHTTGYGEPGGFVSLAASPGLEGTGCEACHGPGSEHINAAKAAPRFADGHKKINKVPQNACVHCHNPHINQKDRVAKLRAMGG